MIGIHFFDNYTDFVIYQRSVFTFEALYSETLYSMGQRTRITYNFS